jgi:hypothetical protein
MKIQHRAHIFRSMNPTTFPKTSSAIDLLVFLLLNEKHPNIAPKTPRHLPSHRL